MYRIKVLVVLYTIFTTLSCKSQDKETVYLIFKENLKDNCEYSPYRDGRDKKAIAYTHVKNELSGEIIFKMCYAQFIHSNDLSPKTINNIDTLNIVDMSYMYSEIEKDWPKTAKDVCFKNIYIYILEKKNNGTYLQYDVKWVDKYY